jgi:signal transduction histidine kinase
MPRSSFRSRSLTVLVIGALVVPAILLSVVAFYLLGQLDSLGRRSWGEYGQYLAEISIAHAEQKLWNEEQRLMLITRASPPESAADLPASLALIAANHPMYRLVFLARPDGSLLFMPGTTWEARTEAAVLRALDPVNEALHRETQGPNPLEHLAGEDRGRPFQVTYFLLHSWAGELLGAIVLVWDLGYTKEVVLPLILAQGPPAGKAVFQAGYLREHIALCLIDERGETAFESRPQPGAGLIAAEPFRRVLGFWRLGIRLQDREYRAWIRKIRTTHVALIGGMLVVIVLGAVLALRWIHREIELAQLKSRFVSDVSHDLKTPIALIRLYAETLELGRVRDSERTQEFLHVISREAKRLTHLINNVLDMSRIEAGRKGYSFTQGDLGQIVRETLEAYHYQFDQQGLTVDRKLPSGPMPARFDPEAMTQALINLLDNAIKYSNGSKEIEVSLRREDEHALLSVRDRGIGIPHHEQERIFDLFYRVNDDAVQRVRGSGLGLTLVRHIVEAHGGRVEVKSRPGEGSTFTIVLPLGDGDGGAASRASGSQPAGDGGQERG